ncbi:kinesin, putative [Entamoeba histolytica HM-3:IMSS]|uniref:Kinesin, putative n=1 Tax=Entamoeba histolytica HM-3:IMSS TaxID=885315 RepID=M7X7L6_ENTHI|nr:kinesin, putative [Entamoeba histolytica HM-3:IMSS]
MSLPHSDDLYKHVAQPPPDFSKVPPLFRSTPLIRHHNASKPRLIKETTITKPQNNTKHSSLKLSSSKPIPTFTKQPTFDTSELTKLLGEIMEEKLQQLKKDEIERTEVIGANQVLVNPVQNELKKELEKVESELKLNNEKIKNVEMEKQSILFENESLKNQLNVLKRTVETTNGNWEMEKQMNANAQNKIQELLETIQSLNKQNQFLQSELEKTEDKLIHSEKERRKLHNEVMELKGNVRVFCRVRPPLKNEGISVGVTGDNAVIVNSINFSGKKEKIKFGFDRAFDSDSTQQDVFEEISQLVQSSLDGYQTCIFAYGQTGSGKTYTMEGTNDKPGMIPLTVHKIFTAIEELKTLGWQFKISVKYVEIYNNNIFDLLVNEEESKKLQIKYNGPLVILPEANVIEVSEAEEVDHLINIATRNRAVAATKCNAQSSRSHSIFMMDLCGRNIGSNEQRFGGLTLVDLAGSERLDESGAKGERLEETKNINKSLSALGDVIVAIANKDSHIPYRNSKLTELLQNCLGSDSKTLMFVNISSDQQDTLETISSLRFATKVNTCVIGTAKRHVQ